MQKAKRLKKLIQAQRAASSKGSSCGADCNHDHSSSQFGIPMSKLNAVIENYRVELAAAEKELPPSAFDAWKGQFWSIPETQAYMTIKSELAQVLRMRGDYAEAAMHLRELMELNPGDNQGNRWHLWTTLIDLSKTDPAALDELETVAAGYDEPFSSTVYSKALGLFRKYGATPEAKAALKYAVERNRHVLHLLTRAYPGTNMAPPPPEIALGSAEEANGYVLQAWHQWRETDGWQEFLATAKDS